MSGRGHASRAASGFAAAAYAVLAAATIITVVAACVGGIKPARALPSYARQTGQQCAACHNGFPELTPYGRQFKLNGYTWTGGTWNLPPIAAMAIPTFTNVRKGVDGGLVPGFGYNNDFAFTGSLFYGGRIFDGVGAFAQVTYDQVPNRIRWDNIDLRYALPSELAGREAVFGISANNNPTVNDVWNSTPAWGYPYLASELAPSPGAITLIEGTFAQQVIGLNAYIYWDRLVYAEVGGYGTLSPRTNTTLGIECVNAVNPVNGVIDTITNAIGPVVFGKLHHPAEAKHPQICIVKGGGAGDVRDSNAGVVDHCGVLHLIWAAGVLPV